MTLYDDLAAEYPECQVTGPDGRRVIHLWHAASPPLDGSGAPAPWPCPSVDEVSRHRPGQQIGPDRLREYDRRVQAWINEHPGSTSFEYEKAILAIAREVGV